MNNELKKLNSLFDGSDESAMNIAYDIAHKYSSCRLCGVGKGVGAVIVKDNKDNNSGNHKPNTNIPSTDDDNDNSNVTPSTINKGDVVSKDPSSEIESSASNGSLVLAANSLVNTALGEVGRNNNNLKYGNSSNAWCAYFTTWALKNTKMSDGSTLYSYLNKNGSISDGIASGLWPAFQGNRVSGLGFYKSKTYGGSYTPKIGDIIWFQWKKMAIVEIIMVNGMVVINVLIMLVL